jgi:succinate dehydrogenase/fumarate reductase flavoprotein subunit
MRAVVVKESVMRKRALVVGLGIAGMSAAIGLRAAGRVLRRPAA